MVLKNLFAGQQWRNRHREQTYRHGERGGKGEMYGKSNMETYITICKIDSQWEFAVWLRKLKQSLQECWCFIISIGFSLRVEFKVSLTAR